MSTTHEQHHEDFDTPETRTEIIRSDRLEVIGVNSVLEFPFGCFEVSNYSATGIAVLVQPGQDGFSKSETYTVFHSLDGVKIGTYELYVVRKVRLGPGEGTLVAFELKTGSIPIHTIHTVIKARKVLGGFREAQQELGRIPAEFRRLVLEAKLFLQNLEAQVEGMRVERQYCSLQELQSFENTLIPMVSETITAWSLPAHHQMEASLKGVGDSDLSVCVNFYRDQLKAMVYSSPFAYRSAEKPLGYAGDFEMMNIIYRNENLGDTLFGKCLNAYWLNQSEPKAVRNRSRFLYDVLLQGIRNAAGAPFKVGSIACGPSREVQMIIEYSAEQGIDLSACEFHLLDQDMNALKHAHERLREIVKAKESPVQLNFVHKAVRQLIAHAWKERDFDVLYSAGLFDYFSDAVARMAARNLLERVKPGGLLVIGNFSAAAPNQFGMRVALDWSLIYRSHEDARRLFGDLGGTLTVEEEPEGVHLFCLIRKPMTA